MRILCIDQFSGMGGAQQCLRDVLVEARRRGWDAEVMAPGDGPLFKFARDFGFSAHTLPIAQYAQARQARADLLRFCRDMAQSAMIVRNELRKRRFDLVYVNGPRVLPVAIQPHAPVVFHAHSVVARPYARAVASWSLRGARAAALACSEYAAAPVKAALRGKDVRVIYNGVADCGFLPRPATQRPVRVGLVGRIAPEKGHLDFLKAVQLLSADIGIEFRVVGAAVFSDLQYENSVRSRCTELGVECRGWTSNVAHVLHELDVLVVPSGPDEASTRVVPEAFSAGTCVVAYRSGGLPELIRSGDNGLLLDPRPEALAQAIRKLAGSPELRARFADTGRKDWQRRFTVERFQREVCDQLEFAASRRAISSNGSHSVPEARAHGRDEARASR